jgi:hypothetical protein
MLLGSLSATMLKNFYNHYISLHLLMPMSDHASDQINWPVCSFLKTLHVSSLLSLLHLWCILYRKALELLVSCIIYYWFNQYLSGKKKNQSLTALMRCSHYGANLFFARLTWLLWFVIFSDCVLDRGYWKVQGVVQVQLEAAHIIEAVIACHNVNGEESNFGSVIFSLYLNSGTLTKILVQIELFFLSFSSSLWYVHDTVAKA